MTIMRSTLKNKKLYSRLWRTNKPKSHTFWASWNKYKELIPKKDPKLLDIGCGIRPRIPIKGSYFLDLSNSALEILEANGGICNCGDATSLPYGDQFFDLVNASELLEHIDEDEKAISEVARVLKKRGHFTLSVPLQMRYWTHFDKKVNHVRRYEPKELYDKIKNGGFNVRSFYINNPSKSPLFKNLAAFILSAFPHLGLFVEEHITLPIAEGVQRARKRMWHKDGFLEKLEDASGVIVICQKA
jgi:SAM-dependent methyltransferase